MVPGPMMYLVTAIVQDNREGTMKICARTDDPFDAAHAIMRELMSQVSTDDQIFAEACVRETWAIHSLFLTEET